MRVIKSDGRRKFFREGFTTILEFDSSLADRNLKYEIFTFLTKKYGLSRSNSIFSLSNEHWRNQVYGGRGSSRKSKIYLREESEVTIILLCLGNNQ